MVRVLAIALVLGCGANPPPPSPAPPGSEAPGLVPSGSSTAAVEAPLVRFRGAAGFAGFALDGATRNGEVLVGPGTVTSPVVASPAPFREAVASWNADTPAGTWIEVDLRARIRGAWTKDYVMGIWTSQDDLAHRHSVDGQDDANGTVDTDTLRLSTTADAWQMVVRLQGAARLRMVAVIATDPDAAAPALAPFPAAYGVAADVPERSQMIYPDGGEVWCSPTSTSMLLAFWGVDETVPAAAAACDDPTWGGTGNWPFNTAHAATAGGAGMEAFVTRLLRIEQLERLTAAGFPVAASISFRSGELDGAPIDSTAGHLIVVRGFDAAGDVLVNDPAGPSDSEVRYTYQRAQLDAAWAHSGRTIYLIHPLSRPLPSDGSLGFW